MTTCRILTEYLIKRPPIRVSFTRRVFNAPHGHAFLTREVATVLYTTQTHNGILLLFYSLIITSLTGHKLLTQRTQASAKRTGAVKRNEVSRSRIPKDYGLLGLDIKCSGRLVCVYTGRYHKLYQTSRCYFVKYFWYKKFCFNFCPNINRHIFKSIVIYVTEFFKTYMPYFTVQIKRKLWIR